MSENIYKAKAYIAYKDSDMGMLETNREALYTSSDEVKAVKDALRWAKRALEQYMIFQENSEDLENLEDPEGFLCGMYVHTYHVNEIDKEGFCFSGTGSRIFEWKAGYPGGDLDNYVETFVKNSEKIKQDL